MNVIVEFLELWDILSNVELQPGIDDSIIIFGNSSGQYTAKSADRGSFRDRLPGGVLIIPLVAFIVTKTLPLGL